VWELGRGTSVQRRFATGVTTRITHMLARHTATGALTTLWAACLSVPARGSMVSMVPAMGVVFTVEATMAAVIGDTASTVAISIAVEISEDAMASTIEGLTAADSAVVIAAFTEEAVSMEAEVSTAAMGSAGILEASTVEVDSTAEEAVEVFTVAVATAADTGNFS